jgi:hypothetical protein
MLLLYPKVYHHIYKSQPLVPELMCNVLQICILLSSLMIRLGGRSCVIFLLSLASH